MDIRESESYNKFMDLATEFLTKIIELLDQEDAMEGVNQGIEDMQNDEYIDKILEKIL